ncbi:MAG: VWA domain-containing protein [Candidatus Bipolaricaulia bacterium]
MLLGLIGLALFISWFWLIGQSSKRGPHGAPHWPSFLRGAALALIVLALAEPRLGLRVREGYIYFALDLSGSISRSREELLESVGSLMIRREGISYGLILFGAEAAVDQGFRPELELDPRRVLTLVPREGTDLVGALELALNSFPREGERAIVLLTDGLATQGQGELLPVLARAAREGVRIAVLPIRLESGEVWLGELSLPEGVPPETEFPLRLKLGALQATTARLLIYRDGLLIEARELELSQGVNELILAERLAEPGLHRYRAYLLSEEDAVPENNSAEAITLVRGGPQVLWLAEEERHSALGGLLQAAGYPYLSSSPARFSWSPADLGAFRLVVLDNPKLARLDERAIAALERYVAGGGGLLLIQGQRAVEGLRKSELERLLPVSYEGREPSQAPSLAVVFVLDRSSSMIGKKIQALKEAAGASVELLERQDLVGLLAFDTMFHWLIPIQPAEDKEPMYRQIGTLQANGGTDLLPALEEAFQELDQVEAKLKHILVFSDGKALLHELEFPKLLERIKEAKITVSAIAIGEDADVAFLRGLTEKTGGELYQVKNPKDLPRVTLKEVERVTRQRWLTGEIEAVPGPYAHLLEGIEELPPLGGYVVTYPKEASEVALLSRAGDPLVSFWRFGLGRVGVLNTDLEGRWSASWLAWEGIARLFASIFRESYGLPLGEGISIKATSSGSGLNLTAEISSGGRWADLLEVRGQLASEETKEEFELEQVGPGLYRAELPGLEPGSYLLSLSAESADQKVAAKMEPLTIPYPEEYRRIGVDELLLEEIVATTGGIFLEDKLPEEFLSGRPVYKYRDLTRLLLLLALCSFLAELALRKFT